MDGTATGEGDDDAPVKVGAVQAATDAGCAVVSTDSEAMVDDSGNGLGGGLDAPSTKGGTAAVVAAVGEGDADDAEDDGLRVTVLDMSHEPTGGLGAGYALPETLEVRLVADFSARMLVTLSKRCTAMGIGGTALCACAELSGCVQQAN